MAAAAIFDWSRPPEGQLSARAYLVLIVQPYQRFVSPKTKGFIRCRYRPSCSAYSREAVRHHGFPRGLWLTVKRIVRCNPSVPLGTHDPVPVPH